MGCDPADGLEPHLAQEGPFVRVLDPAIGLADLPVSAVQQGEGWQRAGSQGGWDDTGSYLAPVGAHWNLLSRVFRVGQKHVQAMALSMAMSMALVIALAIGLLVGAAPAPAAGLSGAELFSNHCAGCHVNGGNIIRRGQTLKLAALERHGIDGPAGILEIAVAGRGQMAGYGAVLGETGAEAVAAYVWQQALLDWPRG